MASHSLISKTNIESCLTHYSNCSVEMLLHNKVYFVHQSHSSKLLNAHHPRRLIQCSLQCIDKSQEQHIIGVGHSWCTQLKEMKGCFYSKHCLDDVVDRFLTLVAVISSVATVDACTGFGSTAVVIGPTSIIPIANSCRENMENEKNNYMKVCLFKFSHGNIISVTRWFHQTPLS